MTARTGTDQLYAEELGELWTALLRTLSRLDLAASGARRARRRRRRAVASAAAVLAPRLLRARRRPRPAAGRGDGPLPSSRPRCSAARDATAEVAEAVSAWGAAGVEPLLHEWRGALFRVRLARLRLTPPGADRRRRARRGLRRPGTAAGSRSCSRCSAQSRSSAARRRARGRSGPAGMLAVGASVVVYRPVGRAASRASDFSLPSSSMLSNRPGEIFEPVIASRIG